MEEERSIDFSEYMKGDSVDTKNKYLTAEQIAELSEFVSKNNIKRLTFKIDNSTDDDQEAIDIEVYNSLATLFNDNDHITHVNIDFKTHFNCPLKELFGKNSISLREIIMSNSTMEFRNAHSFTNCPNLRRVSLPNDKTDVSDGFFMNLIIKSIKKLISYEIPYLETKGMAALRLRGFASTPLSGILIELNTFFKSNFSKDIRETVEKSEKFLSDGNLEGATQQLIYANELREIRGLTYAVPLSLENMRIRLKRFVENLALLRNHFSNTNKQNRALKALYLHDNYKTNSGVSLEIARTLLMANLDVMPYAKNHSDRYLLVMYFLQFVKDNPEAKNIKRQAFHNMIAFTKDPYRINAAFVKEADDENLSIPQAIFHCKLIQLLKASKLTGDAIEKYLLSETADDELAFNILKTHKEVFMETHPKLAQPLFQYQQSGDFDRANKFQGEVNRVKDQILRWIKNPEKSHDEDRIEKLEQNQEKMLAKIDGLSEQIKKQNTLILKLLQERQPDKSGKAEKAEEAEEKEMSGSEKPRFF